ncbi:inositol monophosphatase [Candidatus Micrarchaeota archaeon]|nr:inositol monophosphatase [Candidatus Micrarchaeota archaeon]
MEGTYKEIIEFILASGKRIAKRAGKIDDIGIKKQYLTEEDIAIERGMREIIRRRHPEHWFFAEEEHDVFSESEDLWIADPISGTKTFIRGLPHYGIVIAYAKNNVVQFAAVYDPSAEELFTAYTGKGAFLNGKKIFVSEQKDGFGVLFNSSSVWKGEMLERLQEFNVVTNTSSYAVNYCNVACGRYDGTVSFCKDSFPSFAGSLILQEAGGVFTNNRGESNFHHTDRVFIGGNKDAYDKLLRILQQVNPPSSLK